MRPLPPRQTAARITGGSIGSIDDAIRASGRLSRLLVRKVIYTHARTITDGRCPHRYVAVTHTANPRSRLLLPPYQIIGQNKIKHVISDLHPVRRESHRDASRRVAADQPRSNDLIRRDEYL